MTEPILKIDNLDVSYGESKVLRDVNMSIQPNGITAVMGRNGVGKTTLLKALMGLLPSDSGKIQLDGKDISDSRTDQRAHDGIAFVPQGREIFPRLTVEENLLMGLEVNPKLRKVPSTHEIYELFPVLGKMSRRQGGNLSGGQQQQLAIARALLGEPKILILDEPTEGIQPSIILDIERALKLLRSRGNITIILVEQYYDFAERLADYYYMMDRGSVVLHGARGEVAAEDVKRYLAF